jgi:hypothetical protein
MGSRVDRIEGGDANYFRIDAQSDDVVTDVGTFPSNIDQLCTV